MFRKISHIYHIGIEGKKTNLTSINCFVSMFDRNLKQRKQSDTEEGTCMVHIVSLEVNIVFLEERFLRSISNNSVI